MQAQRKPTSFISIWLYLKPILRALITPTAQFYPNISAQEFLKIRTLKISLIALGFLSIIMSIPISLFEVSSSNHPYRYWALSAFWLFSVLGYTLTWRGMWKWVMHTLYIAIMLIVSAEAVYLGHGGMRILYYLVFVVAWVSYYISWRAWILFMVANLVLMMVYALIIPSRLTMDFIGHVLFFSLVSYGIFILVRLYRETSIAQFYRQIALSEAYLRTTIEASDDGYYLLKAVFDEDILHNVIDFRIIEVNEAACKQLSMTREQLLNGLICELFPVNKTGGFFEQYKDVYLSGEKLEQEYYIPEGRAGTGWYYHQVVKVADGLVIMNRDITERKQYELDLVRRQNRLQSLLESQSAYVIRTDTEGKYTYANARFLQQFGYTQQGIMGKNSIDSIYLEDHQKTLDAVMACYKIPGRPVSVTLRKIRADGIMIWTDWEFTAILDNVGMVSEIQCVGLDATARIETEKARLEAEELRLQLQQQEELNQIKTRMMTRISHEFRTPLSIIRSSTNLLERYSDRMDDERRLEKLIHINDEIDHLTKMVDDMGRILKGDFEQPLIMTACDLPALIKKMVMRYHETEIHPIVVKIQPDFPSVMVDEPLIDHIINNLLSNAIKFSSPSHTIAISASYTDTHFSIVVMDSGIGILPSEIDHIYDPFFRGTNFDEIGGMGLGLSLVKKAVQAHHGTIEEHSVVGMGTTFTVTIPR